LIENLVVKFDLDQTANIFLQNDLTCDFLGFHEAKGCWPPTLSRWTFILGQWNGQATYVLLFSPGSKIIVLKDYGCAVCKESEKCTPKLERARKRNII
jgi:hypothetical protein